MCWSLDFLRSIYSLCIVSVCNFDCFQVGFRWQDCVSDTPVSGNCFLFTLLSCTKSYRRISVC